MGIESLTFNAVYKLALKSGYYRTLHSAYRPASEFAIPATAKSFPFDIPSRKQLEELDVKDDGIAEAEHIVQGQFRLFGGKLVDIHLAPQPPLKHWSQTNDHQQDLKITWEPARLEWVFSLGRAYLFTGDERYPGAFWKLMQEFLDGNPVDLGPNWASAQESAIRLFGILFALQIFADSKEISPERHLRLSTALIEHAKRIPPTLIYARAQNNNHLLTESAGLFLTGIALSEFPEAEKWRKLGWNWFNHAIQKQIDQDGNYIQHSMNYHRLMLQTALLVHSGAKRQGMQFPSKTQNKLALATFWLLSQLDPVSGHVPNLGSNDGAYLFPLASSAFDDYRPVAQAAGYAFLGQTLLPRGTWDEMSLWFGLELKNNPSPAPAIPNSSPVLKLGDKEGWGTLRAATFTSRPSHADQLHVDLWWQGHNIAQDAGTYCYTAPSPWNNSLARTQVHNTLTVDDQDQMRRVSRFLWLDWAQAKPLSHSDQDTVAAEHNGYARLGVKHRRSLSHPSPEIWLVRDEIIPLSLQPSIRQVALHWLLPDWEWALSETHLSLTAPAGRIELKIDLAEKNAPVKIHQVRLVRAGNVLMGQPADLPTLGWCSPTYHHKIPALSYQVIISEKPPFSILSEWRLICTSS